MGNYRDDQVNNAQVGSNRIIPLFVLDEDKFKGEELILSRKRYNANRNRIREKEIKYLYDRYVSKGEASVAQYYQKWLEANDLKIIYVETGEIQSEKNESQSVNSEKVKVTKAQAEWLEDYTLTQDQIDHYIDIQPLNLRPDSPIADWKASKLAKALYIGYEVEFGLEISDWVLPRLEGYLGSKYPQKIIRIEADHTGGNRIFLEDGLWSYESQLKCATSEEIAIEKERQFFAKNDRKPWELREHDLLMNESDEICEVVGVDSESNQLTIENIKHGDCCHIKQDNLDELRKYRVRYFKIGGFSWKKRK